MRAFWYYTVAKLPHGRIVVGRHYTKRAAGNAAKWARRVYRDSLADLRSDVYTVSVRDLNLNAGLWIGADLNDVHGR